MRSIFKIKKNKTLCEKVGHRCRKVWDPYLSWQTKILKKEKKWMKKNEGVVGGIVLASFGASVVAIVAGTAAVNREAKKAELEREEEVRKAAEDRVAETAKATKAAKATVGNTVIDTTGETKEES